MLERQLPDRVLQLDSLDVHASTAEISAAAQRGASQLRDRRDLRRVSSIVEGRAHDDSVVLGASATKTALDERRVRELYVTARFIDANMSDAEDMVRAAIGQGARVEEVSRSVAARLDGHGGVGAQLRFRLHETSPSPDEPAMHSASTIDSRESGAALLA
jgi:hypothetical protein